MVFKQGNTYQLKGKVKGIDVSEISKVVFKFNDIEKIYPTNVTYENEVFTIPLTQQETLTLQDEVKYEVAVKFTNNQVKRSVVNETNSLYTIIEEAI